MIPGIQEIKALAIKYSKKQLASMAQTGLIDPQKAVMAGMMRDRIAKEDMQPPSTTVAQDVLGMGPQAQPQMGMQPQMGQPQGQPQPQMPPPQMGAPMGQPPVMAASGGLTDLPVDVQDYAGGGIVAFDDGGAVPGYAEGGDATSPFGRFVQAGRAQGAEYEERERLRNQIISDVGPYAGVGGFFMPQTDAEREAAQQAMQNIDKLSTQQLRDAVRTRTLPTSPPPPTTGPSTFTPATAPAAQNAPPAPAPAPAPTARRERTGPTATGPRGPAAPTAPGLKRPEYAMPDIKGLRPEAFTTRPAKELPAIGKERTEYLRSMGVDPDMYNKMIEKEEGKRKDLQGRKDVAKGEALMEVGLGLIGARRGQEFQALGEAGKRGLAGLREAGKELRAAEEKLDDRINSFRMADQQFKQTGAEKDLARRDAELARVEAAEREAIKERNTFTVKRAELGADVAKTQFQGDISLYGQDVQAQLERQKIAIQAQQAANQAAYYNKSLALTEARLKSMDAATQARFGKLQLDAGKMWENSQEKFNLEKQLKSQYGDNYMNAPKAQVAIKQAQRAYIGQYLDQNDALVHAAPDHSTF